MKRPHLSLIVPCLNEAPILSDSIGEVMKVLDNTRFDYEIIFVDDCSRDATREVIERIISANPGRRFKKIFHEVNTGRGRAVADGIKASEGDVAGFIDIDLEVHARYIPSCAQAVMDGYDIAVAHRIYKFHFRSLVRYVMSKGYNALVRRYMRIDLKDTETGFKFFKRDRILPLILNDVKEGGWFWDTEVMARSYLKGLSIKEIPCLFQKNFQKRSTVREISDSWYYLKKLVWFRGVIKTLTAGSAKDYWQKTPDNFSRLYCPGNRGFAGRFLNARLSRIGSMLNVKPGDEALDAGCGSGEYTKALLRRGAKVAAADYSGEMLSICEHELRSAGLSGYSLLCCEASSIPAPDGKFDLVVSVGLLDYMNNAQEALNEFYRISRPGAKIVFTIPKRPSPFFMFRQGAGKYLRKRLFKLPCIVTAVDRGELEKMLAIARLNSERITSLWMTMWIVECRKEA